MSGRGPGRRLGMAVVGGLAVVALITALHAQERTQEPPAALQEIDPVMYIKVDIEKPFRQIMQEDVAQRNEVMERQQTLLEARYDLSDNPREMMMSGGRRAIQKGVRVKLPEEVTWDQLAQMSPAEIREKGLWPKGFLPLPHVKHRTGGQVFPQDQIDAIEKAERRSLNRFDVEFDLPVHFLPEFPPPIFLQSRPDLGDVSQGQVLTIKNFYDIMYGKITPVQMEGLRLLLTPFPQQQFNATEDRKSEEPSMGVSCLDCHTNGHTNGAFHLNPDTRPQAARSRLDTVSLRGMYNQQIHGSKRSLRSVEDFTEFEQRTAYFDGDHVTAAKKGINVLERGGQASVMAQMQNMFDFPPAPKLNVLSKLDPAKATEQEMLGQEVFFGKGQCGECHPAPHYMDNLMHDLQEDRFYEPSMINEQYTIGFGPVKTFTLRGIKDSPPYMHDGRCLTLEDTVEFFNLVLGTKLTQQEKDALVAFMLQL